MDHSSFRGQLTFAIGFAVRRSRDLLRDILKQHVSDGAREQLGKRVVEHLELSGFEIDEEGHALRKRATEEALTGSGLLLCLYPSVRSQPCLRTAHGQEQSPPRPARTDRSAARRAGRRAGERTRGADQAEGLASLVAELRRDERAA
jgi:hypothetical protein